MSLPHRNRFVFTSLFIGALGIEMIGAPPTVHAACKTAEVRFAPQGFPRGGTYPERFPQIAVWVEEPSGAFVADLFVTKAVGLMGIGNRPGQAFLKSDFRWPYGRRPMTLPVWAHKRNKSYGYVIMGGSCSKAGTVSCPPDFNGSPSEDDDTVAYHGPVSSTESYFCSPSGFRVTMMGGVDVVSCASAFYGSKGWYKPGVTSKYPPRGDLVAYNANDHSDAKKFATDNDVVAVSAATPKNGEVLSPPIVWVLPTASPLPEYVVKVEVNIESDFNTNFPSGKAVPEPHSEWNFLGTDPFGQPSVVYSTKLKTDGTDTVFVTRNIEGYGDWKGESGVLNLKDSTISTTNGSGEDRLRLFTDAAGMWRVKVTAAGCDPLPCPEQQGPSTAAAFLEGVNAIRLTFNAAEGPPPSTYLIRFRTDEPVTAANFDTSLPVAAPRQSGDVWTTLLSDLLPGKTYYIGVRALNSCGNYSRIVTPSPLFLPFPMAPPIDEPLPEVQMTGCGCSVLTRRPQSTSMLALLLPLAGLIVARRRRV